MSHTRVGGFVARSRWRSRAGEAWHALRASRLTASAFGNAHLLTVLARRARARGRRSWVRRALRRERRHRVGHRARGRGRDGARRSTGADVSHMLFRFCPRTKRSSGRAPPRTACCAFRGDQRRRERGRERRQENGVAFAARACWRSSALWNKGDRAERGAVPARADEGTYAPQAQEPAAVFDRPYCRRLRRTPSRNGAAIYRVRRAACVRRLWARRPERLRWQHVVPGKHALAAGEDPERHRPGRRTR